MALFFYKTKPTVYCYYNMTLANTNALPYIRVIFTGRDLVISKVVLFNKDTKQDLSITDSSEWSIIGNNININLVNHISFLSKIMARVNPYDKGELHQTIFSGGLRPAIL